MSLSRRELLRLAAAAAAAPVLPPARAAAAAPGQAGRFFSGPELALLDELTELILPADEHSGGARAAGVAAHIDGRLAEFDPSLPEHAEARAAWTAGLRRIEALAREAYGRPFLAACSEERVALLERLAAREQDPVSEEERFFVELKSWTAHGYYTSRIGIHDELEYQGNTLLPEFVGALPAPLPETASGDEGAG